MSYDERTVITHVQRLSLRDLRVWVREGWVRPMEGEDGPVFDEVDIARVRLLRDLKKDMSIPSDTLPLVLSLIDRLNMTLREFRCLQGALEDQPEEVRRDIVARYASLREEME
ncbi:MAG: hypothetical protein ACX93P_13195 [Roseovarius sp.]